ncbi:DUF4125 family protein [uncultured Anaerococcus sp.]|uniref:DUF4125 family protein n=1 Tax=uncultured Anaerococcus sp. TaxID=293428 RepID=UPI0028892B0D|nr:DUF4125 family protein [uncultured Anaerococcus sp.]
MRNLNKVFSNKALLEFIRKSTVDGSHMSDIIEVIEMEWLFFDKVNGLSGRAFCQDNSTTFVNMRLAQYLAFDYKIVNSIKKDYKNLLDKGLNPIEGKYIRMMKYTDKDLYENLKYSLEPISPIKENLLNHIRNMLETYSEKFAKNFVISNSYSRPNESRVNQVSKVDYFISELSFLSLRTLWFIEENLGKNKSFIESIYINTVKISEII